MGSVKDDWQGAHLIKGIPRDKNKHSTYIAKLRGKETVSLQQHRHHAAITGFRVPGASEANVARMLASALARAGDKI